MDEVEYYKLISMLTPHIRRMRRSMRLLVGEDDLIQDALERLLKASAEIERDKLVFSVSRSACVDAYRRQKRKEREQEMYICESDSSGEEDLTSYLATLLGGKEWYLQKAIRLKVAGFSWEEVAKQVAKPLKQLKLECEAFVTSVVK